jgi:hypothetical protein
MSAESASGYLHRSYAEAFAEFGDPIRLEGCGGWILRRSIPESHRCDAMSCYPIFTCRDWSGLPTDLARNHADLVSLTLILDPFGDYDPDVLAHDLDVMVPFKRHFVADLGRPPSDIVSRHHRKRAEKGLRRVQVERCEDPPRFLDTWTTLYENLTRRHSIKEMRAFSRFSFAKQLDVPGLVMFRALQDGRTVGIDLWYVQGDVAYNHLTAMAEEGYHLYASYALKWFALSYLPECANWLDLGGVPGLDDSAATGLAYFKEGWSTNTRLAYLAGRIYDRNAYRTEMQRRGISHNSYFPAYRREEFSQEADSVAAG